MESLGEVLRDDGMNRAVAHADAEHPCWSLGLDVWMRGMAVKHKGKTFTTEELRASSLFYGIPEPPDARAFGAIVRKAAKDGLIVATGEWRKCRSPHGHMRDVRVWRFV